MKEDWFTEGLNEYLSSLTNRETKEEITNKYIKGIIDKDEFMKRMKNARR